MTPVFIFSLPRSGSTLLQAIVANHPQVATVPEPWLLLPLVYLKRKDGASAAAEYDSALLAKALDGVIERLPDGEADLDAEIRNFAYGIYARLATGGERYFLDKTPRYHLIAEEIHALFPEAKFIYLWRNPLAVAASIVTSWQSNRWMLRPYEIDLYGGLDSLLKSSAAHRNVSFSLKYEDLAAAPEPSLEKLFAYLELDFDPAFLENLASSPAYGSMGDKSNTASRGRISADPIERWKAAVCNPLRKSWCLSYLDRIGTENLRRMGYDRDDLARQVRAIGPGLSSLTVDLLSRIVSRIS